MIRIAPLFLRAKCLNGWYIACRGRPHQTLQLLSELQEQNVIDGFLSSPDEESFRALFRVITPRVFRYLRLHGCDHGLAEDLTQEVMMAVYTQNHALRDRALFRPWLFRIVRNVWLQHLRHESRQVRLTDVQTLADILTGGAGGNSIGNGPDFSRWLAALPHGDRELIVLRYIEGLEHHEIASMLNRPIGTVQWKIFQLKRKLAAHFRQADQPQDKSS